MRYSIIYYRYQVLSKTSIQSSIDPKFQLYKVSKFQIFKFSRFQDSKVSKFHSFKGSYFLSFKISKIQSSKIPEFQKIKFQSFNLSNSQSSQIPKFQKSWNTRCPFCQILRFRDLQKYCLLFGSTYFSYRFEVLLHKIREPKS